MQKFIYTLLQKVLKLQQENQQKRLAKLATSYSNGTSKTVFHGELELQLTSETENIKAELDKKVKEITKEKLNNPEKLLEFINEEGTDVFRLKNADIFLQLIGEEEGFIPPTKGFKALLLNLFVNFATYKKIVISFKSTDMFILRPLAVDIYYMIHQFHMWYAFKLGLPGFEFKDRENFKKVFKSLKQEDISNLTLGEIITLKETIARDTEAIDFVVNLCKEYDSSKKLVNKIKQGQSVRV